MNKGLAASRIGVAGAIMIEWIYALSGENAGHICSIYVNEYRLVGSEDLLLLLRVL